jgi:hypothetical protein
VSPPLGRAPRTGKSVPFRSCMRARGSNVQPNGVKQSALRFALFRFLLAGFPFPFAPAFHLLPFLKSSEIKRNQMKPSDQVKPSETKRNEVRPSGTQLNFTDIKCNQNKPNETK